MADKALISELTWRSLEMQKAEFPDMQHYIAPDEIDVLLKRTTRKEELNIYVSSLAIVADNEKDFRHFMKLLKERGASLMFPNAESEGGGSRIFSIEKSVREWKKARKLGVQKIGGRISADKRKAESKSGADKIKDRWGMPSKIWPTKILLKEADMAYNTAIQYLGKRPIAQYNYQAKLKRKARKDEKN